MVIMNVPTTEVKEAMIQATRVLMVSFGRTITYKFNDGSPDETFKAKRLKLKQEELVGDFSQGGVKFLIDATTISKAPEKYDEVVMSDGMTYALIDVNSVDVAADDTVIMYKPQALG